MQYLQLQPDIHHVTDLPLTHYIRRTLDDPTLMTYHHKENGNWVIGYWVSRLRGVVRELMVIGQSPLSLTRQHVERLRRMLWAGPSTKELKGIAREHERKFLESQLETQELWNSQKRHLRKSLPGVQGDHPTLAGP